MFFTRGGTNLITTENTVIQIDCEDCKESLSSVFMSNRCLKCVKGKDYDRLRLKSKLFTKEYDKHNKLLTVIPFFIDVRLGVITEKVKVVSSYTIERTGAKVYILQRLENLGYIYYIKIPEVSVTFQQLFRHLI